MFISIKINILNTLNSKLTKSMTCMDAWKEKGDSQQKREVKGTKSKINEKS